MNTTRTLLALAIAGTLAACGSSTDNKAPEFEQSNYGFSTIEDTAIDGNVIATDAESDAISYTVVNAASNGVFALNADGSFTYTPSADFNGSDSVTVQAADESEQSQVTISFDVSAVNDAPVLTSSVFSVTTSDTTVATLAVTDVDNDDIIFSLVQAPATGTLTLTDDGEVTYTGAELDTVSGSFVVSYTDGVIAEPIEATITLQAAMVTNEDKLTYYYSSAKSHLAQAEAIKAAIADDATQDNINIDLAASYYAAGFDEKAETTINEISSVYYKAKAYRESALALDARGLLDKAAELRGHSEANYNLYLAEKGFDYISSSDATFFLTLVNHYRNSEQLDAASQLLIRLKLYASAVQEDEYNAIYGTFITAFNNNAGDAVEVYLADNTEENRLLALENIQHLADIAEGTGYNIEVSSGNYTDEPSERQKALRLAWVTEHFYNINADEKAKEYLAKTLALYGEVAYDEDYVYEIGEYYEATRGHRTSYMYAVSELAGMFARYYPNAENNIPVTLVDTYGSSYYQSNAREQLYSATIINDVIAGNGVEASVAAATTYFTAEGDIGALYETFAGYLTYDTGVAQVLYTLGYQDTAINLLEQASDILISDAYIDEQSSNTTVTGKAGCFWLTSLQLTVGGDAAAQAAKCATLVNENYSPESSESTATIISAHIHLLNTYGLVADLTQVNDIADIIISEIAKLDDVEDQVVAQFNLAGYLMKFGLFDKSQQVLVSGLTAIDTLISADDTDVVEDALSTLNTYVLTNGATASGVLGYDAYIYAMKTNALNITDYQAFYQSVLASVTSRVTALTTKVLTLADETIQNNIADLVMLNFYSGQTAMATTLIENDINGDADKLSLNANLAGYYAGMNDLPAAGIATVDTDHDGLPNFFLIDISDEDIAASGLTLDDDSDNDGIVDTADSTPLGD